MTAITRWALALGSELKAGDVVSTPWAHDAGDILISIERDGYAANYRIAEFTEATAMVHADSLYYRRKNLQ